MGCKRHGYNNPTFCPVCDQETIEADAMAEVLSGCAVRAVIQQEKSALSDEDRHYLGSIRVRLNALYELTEAPNIREQISDEISWIGEKLGDQE